MSRSYICTIRLAFALCTITLSRFAIAQENKPLPYYEEEVAASNPIRSEQARELDAYILRQKADTERLATIFKPDYSSPKAFENSAKKLRQAFKDSIGYPPPGTPDPEAPTFTRIGEDLLATYYRVRISVLPGVHTVGLYLVPKGLKGRAPLVISMHGGGGSPEVALFHGGANYHEMVRGGVKRGYVVFAPQHLFRAEGFPGDVRSKTDDRLRLIGTTITAVEIAKITRALDVLLKRPEVDSKRVAMIGLSYGGFYTLVTTALEPRIKAAVSSCYFGVQEARYEKDEAGVPSDFRTPNRMTLLRDPEIVALICPRALEIHAGVKDEIIPIEMGRRLAIPAGDYYRKVGKGEAFRFVEFAGGHEFHDASAWEFLQKHL